MGLLLTGCEKSIKKIDWPEEGPVTIDANTTIGSLVEVFSFGALPVEGYSLVDGLKGTGSAECPPEIKGYLTQYILKHLPDQEADVEKFISSRNTAVVHVYGIIPSTVSKNDYFDVRVQALPGTQTTSLEDGWLYGAELREAGRFGMTIKTLADASGPVFIDTIDTKRRIDKRFGYILAGGTVLEWHSVSLVLRQPDYQIANTIRNRLNERFGEGTAKAISSSQIELKFPPKYKEQKLRFLALIKATYLEETPQINKERIRTFVKELALSEDKDASETALEAIGNESLGKLAALLNSTDREVRLRAARCMLNLGSDRGLDILREIAMDKESMWRIEALVAITTAASRNDAAALSRRLLRDSDFNIRLAAYEQLRKLDDISVTRRLIARNFFLEKITQTPYKGVFVSRRGQPRIVLLGAPIFCHEDIFVQSADGKITINAPAGQKHISIIHKHPTRPNVIIQLQSSFELSDIIETLCEEPVKEKGRGRRGLGVSYAEMIALLKQMCDKGAVEAEFQAGPLVKIGRIIKKQ